MAYEWKTLTAVMTPKGVQFVYGTSIADTMRREQEKLNEAVRKVIKAAEMGKCKPRKGGKKG